MNQKFYTVSQAAGILSLSKLTVLRKIQAGEIPSVRLGKKPLIPSEFFQQLRDEAFGEVAQAGEK